MLLPYAFIRLFIAFAVGIVAGTYAPAFHTESTLLVFSAILAYLCLHLLTSNTFKRKNAFALAVMATVLTALFGYVYTLHRTAKFAPTHLLAYKDSLQYYEVELTSELKKTTRGDKAEATILRVCTDTTGQQWHYATGKVMLYFEQLARDTIPIDYGTRLIIKGFPTDIPSPMNPDEFDYHNYMSNLQIYHYHFLQLRDYALIDRSTPNWVQYWSITSRKYCDKVFKTYIKDQESYGLAAALVLGIKENLTDEIKNTYSNSGIMHILAVSGMHVTLLFAIIGFAFKPLEKKYPKWTPFISLFSLVLLWFYAFITGLSASVLRAVVMFTLLLIAKLIDRKYNIYNVLAMAAFVMCLLDPYILFDVGFQLSYLAVLGIVFFHPFISRLYVPNYPTKAVWVSKWAYRWGQVRYYFINNAWTILAVSVAAQITTSPIGLLYFHQFPNYFLVANLIAIPLSTVVMYLNLLLLLLSGIADFIGIFINFGGFFNYLLEWIGWLTEKMIIFLNYLVSFIEKAPFSITTGIHITAWETWAIYAMIIVFILFFYQKKLYYFGIATLLLLGICVSQVIEFSDQYHQQQILFYQTPRATAVEFTDGNKAYFMGHEDLLLNAQKIRFHTYNTQYQRGIQDLHYLPVEDSLQIAKTLVVATEAAKYRLFCFRGKKLVHIRQKMWLNEIPKADFWLISGNAFPKISKKYLPQTKPSMIIIDGSNSLRTAQRFTQKMDSLQFPHHITAVKGAYLSEIR